MGTDEPEESHSLDESCRILTISASLKGSVAFIERLKDLSKASLASDVSSSDSKDNASTDGTVNAHLSSTLYSQSQSISPSRAGPQIIPYTLANKYYSAEVHFAAYALDTVFPGMFSLDRGPEYKPPPAVVFVWQEGEPYAKLVEELAKVMEAAAYEPEVCLAVRIPRPQDAEEDAREDGQEEDTEIDTTLMSYGFEYVDGRQDSLTKTELANEDSDDIPRLPRVLDALSTIMWPSMQSSSTRAKLAKTGLERSAASAARRKREQETIVEELFSVSGISGISRGEALRTMPSFDPNILTSATFGSSTDTDGEMDALFSPYDFTSNTHFGGAPSNAPGLVASPTDLTPGALPFKLGLRQDQAEGFKSQVPMGFDDDFMVVVSAPPEAEADISGTTEIKRRKAPPAITLKNNAGAGVYLDAGLGLGSATPLGTAFADSVRTGDNLTPATALGTGIDATRRSGAYRSLGSVSDFGDFDDEQEGRHAYHAVDGAHMDDEDHAEEWEDEVDEHDESWEEHTGDWEDNMGDSGDDVHDKGTKGDGDSDDEGMPTREEIMATAARIFGGVPASGSTSGFRTAAEVKTEQEALSTQSKTKKPSNATGNSAAAAGSSSALMPDDAEALEGDDDDALGPAGGIDIEHVLRSLQGLKTEIAGVEDEEERRRMAARVALGFVYGMDLDLDGKGERGQG